MPTVQRRDRETGGALGYPNPQPTPPATSYNQGAAGATALGNGRPPSASPALAFLRSLRVPGAGGIPGGSPGPTPPGLIPPSKEPGPPPPEGGPRETDVPPTLIGPGPTPGGRPNRWLGPPVATDGTRPKITGQPGGNILSGVAAIRGGGTGTPGGPRTPPTIPGGTPGPTPASPDDRGLTSPPTPKPFNAPAWLAQSGIAPPTNPNGPSYNPFTGEWDDQTEDGTVDPRGTALPAPKR